LVVFNAAFLLFTAAGLLSNCHCIGNSPTLAPPDIEQLSLNRVIWREAALNLRLEEGLIGNVALRQPFAARPCLASDFWGNLQVANGLEVLWGKE